KAPFNRNGPSVRTGETLNRILGPVAINFHELARAFQVSEGFDHRILRYRIVGQKSVLLDDAHRHAQLVRKNGITNPFGVKPKSFGKSIGDNRDAPTFWRKIRKRAKKVFVKAAIVIDFIVDDIG